MTGTLAANASVYIDGAPVLAGVVDSIEDAARVEVLRGPQAVYFGRSTFSGAINVITKTPDMANFRGKVEGIYDSENSYEGRAQIEGPIVRDILAFRIAGRYSDKNGTYTNIADGKGLGDQKTELLSGALRFTPVDRLAVNLYGYVQKEEDGPTAYGKLSTSSLNCNAGANPGGAFNYICGTVPSRPTIPLGQNTDFTQFANSVLATNTPNNTPANAFIRPLYRNQFLDHVGNERRTKHAHVAAEYDAGFVTISALASLNRIDGIAIFDLDYEDSRAFPNTAPALFPATRQGYQNQYIRAEQYFHDKFAELRATSDPTRPIRFTLGASYFKSQTANLVTTLLGTGGTTTFGLGAVTRTSTPAAFGSVSWDPVPAITLSAEGRYQSDNVKSKRRSSFQGTSGTVQTTTPTSGGQVVAVDTLIAGETFKTFTPRFIAQYRPVAGTMIYASYAEGNNPGTFNTSVLAFTETNPALVQRIQASTGTGIVVQPEKIKNYEAGVKSQFLDGRAQVIAAVYYAEWINQIVAQTFFDSITGTTVGVNTNVGLTHLKGFEIEAEYRPIPQLQLNGQFSYNGSSIKRYICVSCRAFAGANVSVIGNSLPQAPRFSGSAGAQYTMPLSDTLDGYARLDYYYKGSQYIDETNISKTRPQNVFNWKAGIQARAWRLESFITNVFNNRAPQGVARGNDGLRGGVTDFLIAVPDLRRFGVRATYNFGGK